MADILIVDDDVQIRMLLKLLLETEGFSVREAENGRLAVDRYSEKPADVVILDILMPDMEGIETIRKLKGLDPQVQVIALSGGGKFSGEYYLQMIKSFAPRYSFTKPVEPETLIKAVKDILETG